MTKILIASDDLKIRTLVGHFFEVRGLTVLEAATLEEAVETARSEQPAVAILDSDTQSGIDAFAAVKAIKRESPGTKVILLVSDFNSRRQSEARRAADLVLMKDTTLSTTLGVAVVNFAGRA